MVTKSVPKMKKPQIHDSWLAKLDEEFNKEYFTELKSKILADKGKYEISPPSNQIFSTFNRTPLVDEIVQRSFNVNRFWKYSDPFCIIV